MSGSLFADAFRRRSALAAKTAEDAEVLARFAARFVETLKGGGTLFFAGNGGSAADAQHIATEYVVRYKGDRRAMAAIALTTDTSLLTAAGNDLGFDKLFSRQVEAHGTLGGVLLAISTSGNSPSILAAAEQARAMGMTVISLTGDTGGKLAPLTDILLNVPSTSTPIIQQGHLCLYHYLCEVVEARLSNG
jgi:D-sedoheptulose 7-phosphate isomerase